MPVVTLLSDFGTHDHYVAAMKGVILERAPAAALVDVTHQVPPQDVAAAAYLVLAAHPAFPLATVHLAVVDPGVGSARRAVAVEALGQRFVGPDNGLFSYLLDLDARARVYHLDRERFFRHPVSATFHGRDVFAPVAGELAAGREPAELGTPIADPVRLAPLAPSPRPDGALEGRILHVDHFGNCVTCFTRAALPADAAPRLEAGGREIRELRHHYAEAGGRAGGGFALWGSGGFLEISVDGGSAARELGLAAGDPVRLRPG